MDMKQPQSLQNFQTVMSSRVSAVGMFPCGLWTVFMACDTFSLQNRNNNLSSSLYVKDSGLLRLLLPIPGYGQVDLQRFPVRSLFSSCCFCSGWGFSRVGLLTPRPTLLLFHPGLGPAVAELRTQDFSEKSVWCDATDVFQQEDGFSPALWG